MADLKGGGDMSADNRLKLEKKIFIDGEIIVKTGIHVGGSSLGLSIGGANNVVIRNPVTNLPYIPGSSLKGKMRSLLEKCYGLVKITSETKDSKTVWEGRLCEDPAEDVVQMFGASADVEITYADYAPTRLTVRDGKLLNPDELEKAGQTDMYCTEIKTEVSIDRLTSQANPRNFERVPAGARFKLALVLDIYNVDTQESGQGNKAKKREERFMDLIKQGLCLVQDDYLGGHGTRGYGQVCFHVDSVEERSAEYYQKGGINDQRSSFLEKFSPLNCRGAGTGDEV
jgi:CRISPR-associated protein Csm3